MQNILTGIYSAYNGNAALKAALPGGLFFEMAKQSPTLSYATYNMTSARPSYILDTRRFEIVSIQFDIYSATNLLRLAAYQALINLYDDLRPTATGYTSVIMERQLEQLVRDGEQNEIFRAIIAYDCTYLKD